MPIRNPSQSPLSIRLSFCAFIALIGLFCPGSSESKPVNVFILAGQSNMVGHGKVENGRNPEFNDDRPNEKRTIPGGLGSLRHLLEHPETAEQYKHLADPQGNWIECEDVWIYSTARGKEKGKLSVGFGKGGWFGPELGFGHEVDAYLEDPVLIIKTAWGGHSLGIHFRPPSSGPPQYERVKFKTEEVGASYREMIAITKSITGELENYFPELKGYEPRFAGFGWHQGWNDAGSDEMVAEYAENMKHLIHDIRRDLDAPGLPVVIANSGMIGWNAKPGLRVDLCDIQMALASDPEFAGTLASVETRGFSRSVEQIPSKFAYHWNHNAESHYLIGKAMGESMVQLLSGEQPDPPLLKILERFKNHIEGKDRMDEARLTQAFDDLRQNIHQIALSEASLNAAFSLVEAYDQAFQPLFLNAATQGGFRRDDERKALHRALFEIQQGIIDHAYTPENLERYQHILEGRVLQTASYFPGWVDPPADPQKSVKTKINASQPKVWGRPVAFAEDPARRPTGCYLAPGSIAEITVPEQLVNQGYQVRVGAHSWDLRKKRPLRRLDRVSLLFPVDAPTIQVGNPLGGGIYIEVPYQADAGVAEITIRNAVRSPFYSTTTHRPTSLEQWRVEQSHPGPWADFESDKFMMQVPSEWIATFDSPDMLMADWDTAMDCVSTLFGLPLIRNKTVLYVQVDTIIRAGAFSIGYPQSNNPYDPLKKQTGDPAHWFLKGPQSRGQVAFHELGHAQLFTKFKGETEAAVNFLYVAVLNNGFGVDLETAFSRSMWGHEVTIDEAAINWMVTENFRAGNPMNTSHSTKNEVRYQHRGYAKYFDIVKLFGWKALEDFWHSEHLDYMNGIDHPKKTPADSRILRMSKAAGVDLTPLIHFWGVHPDDPEQLKKDIREAGLKPSKKIRERLEYYQSLIPMTREAFTDHAVRFIGHMPSEGKHPDYGEGWYFDRLSTYNASHGAAAQKALQDIMDLKGTSENLP